MLQIHFFHREMKRNIKLHSFFIPLLHVFYNLFPNFFNGPMNRVRIILHKTRIFAIWILIKFGSIIKRIGNLKFFCKDEKSAKLIIKFEKFYIFHEHNFLSIKPVRMRTFLLAQRY